jgi:hypothetical protein
MIAENESKDYIDDSENTAFVSLGTVFREDDRIVDLLDAPIGESLCLKSRYQ